MSNGLSIGAPERVPQPPDSGLRALIIGGVAESLLTFRGPIISALVARGIRVFVAAPPPFSPRVVDGLHGLGAEIRFVNLRRAGLNPAADVAGMWSVWRAIRNVRPTMILNYTAKPVVYGGVAAWLANVPRRCAWITGLGYGFTDGTGSRRTAVAAVLRILYWMAARTYDIVLFQNAEDASMFRSLGIIGPRKKIDITAGSGVDTNHFTVSQLPTAPVFLMAARLLRDKGVFEYVEAACELRRRYPKVRFLLAGAPDENPASVTQKELDIWRQGGDVELLGWVGDIRQAISDCRVYVLPSYREGMPRSVLEAMAMGRAIIATDAPGCRDAVVAGVNGLLVPVRDSAALADAMEQFILNPGLADDMGKASRDRAIEKFDVRTVTAKVLAAMGVK